jgi:hypothetical protein
MVAMYDLLAIREKILQNPREAIRRFVCGGGRELVAGGGRV